MGRVPHYDIFLLDENIREFEALPREELAICLRRLRFSNGDEEELRVEHLGVPIPTMREVRHGRGPAWLGYSDPSSEEEFYNRRQRARARLCRCRR